MINNDQNATNEEKKQDNGADIEEMIKMVMKEEGFDLKCPIRNDHQICPSIARLTKTLILYKRWLQAIYTKSKVKDDVDDTIQVDLQRNIDDNTYKQILIDTINHKHKALTENMHHH